MAVVLADFGNSKIKVALLKKNLNDNSENNIYFENRTKFILIKFYKLPLVQLINKFPNTLINRFYFFVKCIFKFQFNFS